MLSTRKSKLLINAAIITRKYNIGDKDYFFSFFNNQNKSQLEKNWALALKKIKNDQIVKDVKVLFNEEDNNAIILEIKNYNETNTFKILERLNKKFDIKNLKLKEENIERRIRQILAQKFLFQVKEQLEKSFLDSIIPKTFSGKASLMASIILSIFLTPNIINGLTSSNELFIKLLKKEYPGLKNNHITLPILAKYIHEKTKYKFNGSICNDGSLSYSQGRGTCSHHGGVFKYFFAGEYKFTYEECLLKAENDFKNFKLKANSLSWRD